jgi:hypothetical protein
MLAAPQPEPLAELKESAAPSLASAAFASSALGAAAPSLASAAFASSALGAQALYIISDWQ